jgi:uncharacterized protein with von Willebrand factor type A (vWA) domain
MQAAGIEGADFVFITDGVARIEPATLKAWRDLKDENGAHMVTISIGSYRNDQVQAMSDTFVQVASFDDLKKHAEELVVAITQSIIKLEGGD